MFKSLVAAVALASAASVVGAAVQPSAPRKITVEAERFSFFPSRIKVRVGEAIALHLRSADTSHGFSVEGTDIEVEIPKRGQGEVVVQYTPTREGRFRFECDRMCGAEAERARQLFERLSESGRQRLMAFLGSL